MSSRTSRNITAAVTLILLTELHIVCVHGHAEMVQFLVDSKVKLNLCDNQHRSTLMKAVQCQQDQCVSIFLELEADPNMEDINGNTALHLAACIPSLSVALQLLEHKANINAQNRDLTRTTDYLYLYPNATGVGYVARDKFLLVDPRSLAA